MAIRGFSEIYRVWFPLKQSIMPGDRPAGMQEIEFPSGV
ncbi:hypothetical protein FOQG_00803 [Fusarium oxysporum f. sp. raphani 54005]|uniref:Uncharacterized protein n=4 Tax=Fusarium oxysporum TaxID=5507 RepID=X0D330_FUSOX|nr:hypothetical protein FOZG_05245 [Fusarium oxysporum Fo47]EWZ98651.1 hypothetical protein FOWG_02640 [Fusarium oxysporum f. sp. lycopersici MN25]EXL00812.1 hypothetical protein FOQG_00803 [Fusarium oxysporum f. sp. raphani 54005]EXL61800.1 hypothetical protein FOCG_00745 [Fusarium oxysporum f. sp. radicis-lycopersici 26381]EXL73693.1 hypothetical protein FOPG_11031 [Fusarium oxysporum f. sp. conglutinans race 2 54008]EXM36804.1 hypothetical protein FOTG_00784 [Fusarium oxysporum f. sp. vasin